MVMPVIYWFRNDLRLHDNPSLQRAIDTGLPVMSVFILDDVWRAQHPLGFSRTGAFRQKFLQQSLQDLSLRIEKAGSRLWLFQGDSPAILRKIYHETNASAIFAQAEYASEEQNMEATLASDTNLILSPGSLLFHPNQLSFAPDRSPFYYTAFKNKVWELGNWVLPAPAITAIQGVPEIDFSTWAEVFHPTVYTNEDVFQGGESAGLRRLEAYFSTDAPLKYNETRNLLHGKDFSSWLAPWLANGSLSVRSVWAKLKALKVEDEAGAESVKTLQEQLVWRDYFRYLMMRYGSKLFWDKGLRSSEPTMYGDAGSFYKWCMGKTGQPIVDALMNELRQTGFMSNRGRMLVSYYLAKELKVKWQWGAAWFESLLIDYDVYSNYGNWAYQSGRGTDTRVNRRFNLEKQALKFDGDGSYRKKWGSSS
jgi:deoxyribodipyrimidine photo-lyase